MGAAVAAAVDGAAVAAIDSRKRRRSHGSCGRSAAVEDAGVSLVVSDVGDSAAEVAAKLLAAKVADAVVRVDAAGRLGGATGADADGGNVTVGVGTSRGDALVDAPW